MTGQPKAVVEVARRLAFDRTVAKVRGKFVGMPIEALEAIIAEAVAIAQGRSE